MKIDSVLQSRFPESSDMHRKVSSTRVCMSFDELVATKFPEISFSRAKSIQQGTLAVIVASYAQANQVKLYEFDVLEELNLSIDDDSYAVERLRIEITGS